eukprot:scaffold18269_cov71-Phaeocystis_antarctica.AAC.9
MADEAVEAAETRRLVLRGVAGSAVAPWQHHRGRAAGSVGVEAPALERRYGIDMLVRPHRGLTATSSSTLPVRMAISSAMAMKCAVAPRP